MSMIARRLGQLGSAAPWLASLGAIGLLLLVWPAQRALGSSAQDQGESSSKRPSSPLPEDSSASDPAAKSRAAAEKDIDVGEFYTHKGDIDAAISRYQDAAAVAPNFAKPRLLLGEAFEKKGDKTAAVKYYKEYLQVDPKAPDKEKVQKKIEKLTR
jgi:tetratricopeptide (TPR) repeat protein